MLTRQRNCDTYDQFSVNMFTESNVHSPIFNMFLLIVKVLIFNKYFFKH